MARRKKQQAPRNKRYKLSTAIDVNTQTGRAQLWHERLKRAKDILDIDAREKARDRSIRYIDGTYGLTWEGNRVYLNEALPALEDVIFSGFPKIPPVQVDARQPDHEELAKQVAALLDSAFESNLCKVKQAIIAAEWDEIEWGIGFVKSAWREEDKPENYRPTLQTEFLIPHIQAAETENANPEEAEVAENDDDAVHLQIHAGALGLEAHIDAHEARFGRKLFAHPLCLRVDPIRMRYDPDAEEQSEWGWVAELSDELVSDLQDIPGIKNLNPKNCPPIDEFDNLYDRKAKDVNKQAAFDFEKTRVQVWKIHDRANDQYIILPAQQADDTMPIFEADWPYGALDIYHIIVHRPVPGKVAGMATLPLIEPILIELSNTNAAIRRHVRRAANAKMVGPDGNLDETKQRALYTPEMPYVGLPAGALALMKEFRPPGVPAETLAFRDMLLSELRRMLGSDIISQGGETTHAITATETNLRGQTRGIRISRRQEALSQVLSDIARNIAMFYHYWAEQALTVRVMGVGGAQPIKLDPAAIPEDLLVSLDIEALSDQEQSVELQQAQLFLQWLQQLFPGAFDPWKALEFLADRMEIHNPGRFVGKPGEFPVIGQAPGMAGMTRQSAQAGGPSVPQ